jgi:plastocyanin
MRLAIMALAATVAVSACGGDGSGPGQVSTQLAFTAQPSTNTVGQVITPAVQVSVQDASGNLVSSAENTVTLALGVNPSGATLSGTTTANVAGGVASFSDLQISKPGTNYTLSASASGLAGATSTAFDVSPAPGVAAAIASAAGDGQTGTVGQPVGTAPSVKVTDGLGDPVANVSVTFSVASGGGSADGTDQTTDAAGIATVGQWIVGTVAGTNTLVARAPDLAGSPVTFTAMATPGAPVTLTKNAGDNQTTVVASAVTEPPSVLVTDSYENPVADVPVTFAVTSGGGSVAGSSQTTGLDGLATVGSWTLGSTLGQNSLTASSAGLSGSPVTFSAEATLVPTVVRTVEVHNDFFLSLRNGSGHGLGFLENYAVDTIPVGGAITWVWVGQNHNVSIAFSGVNLSGNHSAPFTYSRTYTSAGTYFYRCTNHSQVFSYPLIQGMAGRIEVQ